MKLDFGVVYQGWFGDSARTVAVGKVSDEALRLMRGHPKSRSSRASRGAAGQPRGRHRPRGAAATSRRRLLGGARLQRARDRARSCTSSRQIPNYGAADDGLTLRLGMTLAIEPMVNAGTFKVEILDDDWTAVTLDRALSAHFEHTILITEGEPEILTRG